MLFPDHDKTVETLVEKDYEFGFRSNIDSEKFPKGLNESIIRRISAKKNEPEFMLNFRLKAFAHWQKMAEPHWAAFDYPAIDYNDLHYYASPKSLANKPKSLDEIDPELKRTFDRLGIPLIEQKQLAGVAVDAVFDSVSVATTYKEKLKKHGVIFCSMSEAIIEYPDLIQQYLGSVVPFTDNFFACLNAAVFTDGSFVWIPKGVQCPMDLSTYFRINEENTGQFERTLIICEDQASVSYLEGCTAPKFDSNQLHAAVVELVALEGATIQYSTVQNWYPGDKKTGKGGIYNFVTKRGKCLGRQSKISWTQIETGSAITWKYPSCLLIGDESVGEFYSVALTNHHQRADTGTKMVHIGKNTRSTIISKGISAGSSHNTYRGLVKANKSAHGARNYTQCDSMLIGDTSVANTIPYITTTNKHTVIEHEASTSKVGEDQLFYLMSRGISLDDALATIVSGFCQDVFQKLPDEFALEANQLLSIQLEHSVG
jgi:Fe-S cluster assembly protein SufB